MPLWCGVCLLGIWPKVVLLGDKDSQYNMEIDIFIYQRKNLYTSSKIRSMAGFQAIFFLQMWVSLYLGHRNSELRIHLDGFFSVMMNMKYPSSPLINFSLTSTLSDIMIPTPACILGPFDCKIFSLSLLSGNGCLWTGGGSCMQQKDGLCFHMDSVDLCLFIGKLRPLILRDINDQLPLLSITFVLVLLGVFCKGSLRI